MLFHNKCRICIIIKVSVLLAYSVTMAWGSLVLGVSVLEPVMMFSVISASHHGKKQQQPG